MYTIWAWIRGSILNHQWLLGIIDLFVFILPQIIPIVEVVNQRRVKTDDAISDFWKSVSVVYLSLFGLAPLLMFTRINVVVGQMFIGLFIASVLFLTQLPVFIDDLKKWYVHHMVIFLIVRTVITLIISYVGLWIMFIIGLFWFCTDRNTIWYPYYNLQDIAAEISQNGQLPHSEQELLEISPKMREIAYYGRWCYFYEPGKDDFYLVAEYAGLWFVLTREGELDRSFDIDSRASRGQFARCAAEKWW